MHDEVQTTEKLDTEKKDKGKEKERKKKKQDAASVLIRPRMAKLLLYQHHGALTRLTACAREQ
jgi:hypothetical protein